jgi:hypothetical protein
MVWWKKVLCNEEKLRKEKIIGFFGEGYFVGGKSRGHFG